MLRCMTAKEVGKRGEKNKLAKEVKRSWLRLVRMRTNKYLRETEIMIRIIKKSHPTMIIASVGEGRGGIELIEEVRTLWLC